MHAKSSFCGFKKSQGNNGDIKFDSVTSDNNINGAAINADMGTITIGGSAASYQVSSN